MLSLFALLGFTAGFSSGSKKKKRVRGTFKSLVGMISRQTRRFQAEKKNVVVSAVVEANSRAARSSLRDLHTAHYDAFFHSCRT